jgi:hypothetical protein
LAEEREDASVDWGDEIVAGLVRPVDVLAVLVPLVVG